MATNDSIQGELLPIPDRKPIGLTTYDAKDPKTKFPPITPLRPPTGAPNVLFILPQVSVKGEVGKNEQSRCRHTADGKSAEDTDRPSTGTESTVPWFEGKNRREEKSG
jgi:hypothetical protein